MDEIEATKRQQREWAARTGRQLTTSRAAFTHLDDALFAGLDLQTRSELSAGAGGEVERLVSLRSSSALCVNIFGPWREAPGPVAGLLGGDAASTALRFEAKFPTALAGIPPHLDAVIDGPGMRIAIESKFLETYQPCRNDFRPSYFEDSADDATGLWADLPRCRALAERVADGSEVFRWLHVAQLIKHGLGLRRAGAPFRLVLAWYRIKGAVAAEIDTEIGRFAGLVGDELGFSAVSYQELFERMRSLPEPSPGYFSYLEDRYFF